MDASILTIRPSASEPIYRQILEQIRRLVLGGLLSPGELLPSVRDVAAQHAINPMTVSRAYGMAEAEGLLVRLRGKGMAVARGDASAHSVKQRMALLDPQLREVARHTHELELPVAPVVQRLQKLLGD
ncbi:MAG: GntR family transcriptional regulator [Xanthomonadales bacterium]|nr:GntR family transcriptional regulator [Xanthomonadales bacterium]